MQQITTGATQAYSSTREINAIKRAISQERMGPYLKRSETQPDPLEAALRLYEQNTAISESLYGVIQGLEVPLRNSMHSVLSTQVAVNWFDRFSFGREEQQSIANAKKKISRAGQQLTPGRLVAELTFGFWVALTEKRYSESLWIPHHLHQAFPQRKLGRKRVNARLQELRRLRNRVAHHEIIINRDLEADYNNLLETISWICPYTKAWVERTNCFQKRLGDLKKLGY